MTAKSTAKAPIQTAIIIAGGRGRRLLGLGSEGLELSFPKPMLRILGKPMLEYVIEWLKRYGVRNVIIGVAYRKEKIIEHFGNGKRLGVRIIYSAHDIEAEGATGIAFRHAVETMERHGIKDKYFYAMNADQLTTLDIRKMADHHIKFSGKQMPLATVLLVPPVTNFGMVEVDGRGFVTNFQEKPVLPMHTSAGIYVFSREIKPYLTGSVERDTFVRLAREKKLQSYKYDGHWETINLYIDLIRVEEWLLSSPKLRSYFNVDPHIRS